MKDRLVDGDGHRSAGLEWSDDAGFGSSSAWRLLLGVALGILGGPIGGSLQDEVRLGPRWNQGKGDQGGSLRRQPCTRGDSIKHRLSTLRPAIWDRPVRMTDSIVLGAVAPSRTRELSTA